jgi:HD-GYP domain-containing protein (c-di-GMP phosphodiesterase class II)
MYGGCQVYGNDSAKLFGDDIDFRANALRFDLAGFPAMRFMLGRAGSGGSVANRVRVASTFMASRGRGMLEAMADHCAAAGELAQRLGLSPGVRAGVEQTYARWDGKGWPAGLAGEEVALSARLTHVAEACEVFQRLGGVDGAVEMVQARRGTQFDPQIVDLVCTDTKALFDEIEQDTFDEVIEAEPIERPVLTDEELDRCIAAIGDFCDMRCHYFAGHSQGTAELVTTAAPLLNIPAADTTLARRAAFLHDVGRFGVPGNIWDKPGPLTNTERERMRMHVYYVERIFTRPDPLKRIGLLAATHHERMDGSGYHRGIGATMLSSPARVLAAADAFHAMTQPRPHRPALDPGDAARQLRLDADEGRLDHAAVDAVLSVAGQASNRSRAGGPAGLTTRENEVLALLAEGLPNKAIAQRLQISTKTVGSHIEHIYTKLGVTNRAGAAMRAMEYGVVGLAPKESA